MFLMFENVIIYFVLLIMLILNVFCGFLFLDALKKQAVNIGFILIVVFLE